jgi:hypothetical protein
MLFRFLLSLLDWAIWQQHLGGVAFWASSARGLWTEDGPRLNDEDTADAKGLLLLYLGSLKFVFDFFHVFAGA